MNTGKSISEVKLFFMALADDTRLRILNLMRESEVCVCFFVEILGESQPKISRHLAYLRNAGIVEARRDGKWIHYKIIEPENQLKAQILQQTLRWLRSEMKMQQDYEKLAEVCSSSDAVFITSRAPKPNTFTKSNMNEVAIQELEVFLL